MRYALVRGAPVRLLASAFALLAMYALGHIAGLRQAVGILATGSSKGAVEGLFYAASYFSVVLVAPPLALAAGFIATGRAWQRFRMARGAGRKP